MKLVPRWFMETPEGDILDGPYKNYKEFLKAVALYIKLYKYAPLKIKRMMDPSTFMQSEDYDERGYQTGRKSCRASRRSHQRAQQGTARARA